MVNPKDQHGILHCEDYLARICFRGSRSGPACKFHGVTKVHLQALYWHKRSGCFCGDSAVRNSLRCRNTNRNRKQSRCAGWLTEGRYHHRRGRKGADQPGTGQLYRKCHLWTGDAVQHLSPGRGTGDHCVRGRTDPECHCGAGNPAGSAVRSRQFPLGKTIASHIILKG